TDELLEACAGPQRRWEWHCLNRLTRPEELVLAAHDGPVTAVAFSPDGETLAPAAADGTVKLWDPATGKGRFTFRGHNRPDPLPPGRQALARGDRPGPGRQAGGRGGEPGAAGEPAAGKRGTAGLGSWTGRQDGLPGGRPRDGSRPGLQREKRRPGSADRRPEG